MKLTSMKGWPFKHLTMPQLDRLSLVVDENNMVDAIRLEKLPKILKLAIVREIIKSLPDWLEVKEGK